VIQVLVPEIVGVVLLFVVLVIAAAVAIVLWKQTPVARPLQKRSWANCFHIAWQWKGGYGVCATQRCLIRVPL
jgi:hypothetical protein